MLLQHLAGTTPGTLTCACQPESYRTQGLNLFQHVQPLVKCERQQVKQLEEPLLAKHMHKVLLHIDRSLSNRSPPTFPTLLSLLAGQGTTIVSLQLAAVRNHRQLSAELSVDCTEEASTNRSSAAPTHRRRPRTVQVVHRSFGVWAAAAPPRFQGPKQHSPPQNPAPDLPYLLSGGALASCSAPSSASLASMLRYASSVSTDPTQAIRYATLCMKNPGVRLKDGRVAKPTTVYTRATSWNSRASTYQARLACSRVRVCRAGSSSRQATSVACRGA